MIKIEANASTAAAAAAGVATRTMTKAFAHAANTTILQTRTFILKAMVEQGMKRKYGAAALQNTRATPDELHATLVDGGRAVPLSAFSARSRQVKTARGVRTGVSILINGQRTLVEGGFLVELKSGKIGIFKRVGDARLPIRQQFSSKIMDLYRGIAGLPESTKEFTQSKFKEIFARDFEYYKEKEHAK